MQGVLVIAHGSSNTSWVHLVDEAVNRVDMGMPIVTGFLEMVKGRSIQDGIHQLEKAGVTQMIVVPLFVSSGSTHVQEIRYLLGLSQEIPLEVKEKPFSIQAEIKMTSPMDDHPLILEILEKRVRALSRVPQGETVLLVGHGSKLDGFYDVWEDLLERMAVELQRRIGLRGAAWATLLPDQLSARLKEQASSRIIVIPLFLSEGYFTKKVIPSRMEGIDYIYDGKTYLPDELVSEWITATVGEMRD